MDGGRGEGCCKVHKHVYINKLYVCHVFTNCLISVLTDDYTGITFLLQNLPKIQNKFIFKRLFKNIVMHFVTLNSYFNPDLSLNN